MSINFRDITVYTGIKVSPIFSVVIVSYSLVVFSLIILNSYPLRCNNPMSRETYGLSHSQYLGIKM